MERKTMERRTILKGGAAAIGMLGGASTAVVTGAEQASADTAQSPLPDQISLPFNAFAKPFQPISITTTSRKLSYRFSDEFL